MASKEEYIVTWQIEVDADTPEDAAKAALAIMRDNDPANTAMVFVVEDPYGTATTVDLMTSEVTSMVSVPLPPELVADLARELAKEDAREDVCINPGVYWKCVSGTCLTPSKCQIAEECLATCIYCEKHRGDPMMPPHNASPNCESGRRNHCTCDVCF
jgi:hypothetical protein